jgi:hypothetical protein
MVVLPRKGEGELMNKKDEKWANELMEEEDQLHEEMQVEFRKRLQTRLQKKLDAKEQNMPELRSLKKKGRSISD